MGTATSVQSDTNWPAILRPSCLVVLPKMPQSWVRVGSGGSLIMRHDLCAQMDKPAVWSSSSRWWSTCSKSLGYAR
eukprot:2825108-Amphidinium_carterae.2